MNTIPDAADEVRRRLASGETLDEIRDDFDWRENQPQKQEANNGKGN